MKGSVWQLFLVNALTCGLEVCMAAGTIYMPPLLLQAGMEERYMTMVLAVGPVLGLIFVPVIGAASDSWHGRFGRRRPFIWVLCLGVLLGLLVMPHALRVAAFLSPQHPRWLEAALQAGAVCLLEFCGQACFTPLEALLSDLFPGQRESQKAFSVYALMISLGGCLGYLLPAVDWSHAPMAAYLGGQEAFIFALLTLIFLSCLLSTAFISEERGSRVGEITRKTVIINPLKSWQSRCCVHSLLPQPQCLYLTMGRCLSVSLSVLPRVYGVCMRVPTVIRKLFVAELCSWMALMSFMLFYTDFIGEGLYQGVPSAKPGSEERLRYDEGVRAASKGLFLQCVVSVLCSVVMERWVVLLGARAVYVSSVALLALATAVMSVSESMLMVTAMAALTGYTFCVLQVLPYTLLCLYHSDRQVFFPCSKLRPLHPGKSEDPALSKSLLSSDLATHHGNGHPGGVTLPSAATPPTSPSTHLLMEIDGGEGHPTPVSPRGMCFDLAILDSAYLLSQVLPALCLGSIVQQTDSVRAYMASACSLSLLALLCSNGIIYNHTDLKR